MHNTVVFTDRDNNMTKLEIVLWVAALACLAIATVNGITKSLDNSEQYSYGYEAETDSTVIYDRGA